MPNFIHASKSNFIAVTDHLLSQLQSDEDLNMNLHAEETIFIRLNHSKIRQNTAVEQQTLSLLLQSQQRSAQVSFSLTGHREEDLQRADYWLAQARQECALLPVDPFQVPLSNNGTSDVTFKGRLLSIEEALKSLVAPAQESDLAGLYCAGPLISANRNSKGQNHWFATETFFVDYSLYMGEKAVKGVYAGSEWSQADYEANLTSSQNQLTLMNRPKKVLQPGAYRTYLAPGAVAELSTMFSWGSLSFGAYKQGSSSLLKLANKEKTLSPLFSMRENFAMGLVHRFNSLGELAAEHLDIIRNGELVNFMISTRSAKEYNVTGNAADAWESPRAMEILPGTLHKQDILKTLGTGLYLSNLHYLNWSDRPGARITGMTRYACFWVEDGEIVAPVADMRFDESLYEALGKNLLAVTDFQEVDPQLSTYSSRSLGGKKIPGFLIEDFKFTL